MRLGASMGTWRRALLGIGLASLMWTPAVQAAGSGCQFNLGFKALHDAVPDAVGECVDNAGYGPNGDALQHTTHGLLVWRKVDNVAAFTDGATSWLMGPDGPVSRANSERFSWEAPAASVAGVHISRTIDPAGVVLRPDDPDVGPNFVLSDQTADGAGGFSLTLRSAYSPDRAITTSIMQAPSHEAALAELTRLSDQIPTSNRVLGQPGSGFQNDGAAFVGDNSTFVESRARLLVFWVKDNYLLELDDATRQGFGLAYVRARAVESRLEELLAAPNG